MHSRIRARSIGRTSGGVPDPADLFVALFGGGGDAVWLDAGPDAEEGRSIVAGGSLSATYSVADGRVTARNAGRETLRDGTLIDFVRSDLAAREVRLRNSGFALGWAGWLGYESGAAALGVPVGREVGHAPTADAAMLFLDRAVVVDHERDAMELIWLQDGDDGADPPWLDETLAVIASCGGAAARYSDAHPMPDHPAGARWRHDDAEYLGMIHACQEAIHAGDAYQLCLTNRAEATTEADPLAVHLRLRRSSPAHHGGFLRIGADALISSSPEQFLAVSPDGRVRTKPIKGTRARGSTVARDVELRAELEASEKERAENVMIVDLMRNDLGRVCAVGSIEVRHLLAVESYAQVHQLVSTVEGRLAEGRTALDAVEACFPAGSMTGAPKLSAMRILAGLEGGPRGIYAGCFGYLGLDGSADLAMVIRSIVMNSGRVVIGAGGGITALSDPREELEEVRIKARALFAAAGLEPAGNGSGPVNV